MASGGKVIYHYHIWKVLYDNKQLNNINKSINHHFYEKVSTYYSPFKLKFIILQVQEPY